MPDNRIDITVSARNEATQAINQARQGVEALNREVAKPRVRVAAESVRVYRDALGRLHEESGKYISRQKVLAGGYTIVDGSARKAGEAIGGLNDPLAKTGRGSRGASAGLRVLGQELQITSNIARQFSRVLTSQTRSIITEAANIERLRLGLSTLSPSIAEAEAQYRRLIEVARLPGIDFSNALRASLQLQAIGKTGEEATRILIAFGNSLALSGASTADIQRTIYGLRQLIADGKVYQRELNLITSRVPVATPILQDRFGGVRANDIRQYFESVGVDESQQAAEFIKILTEELEKLPRASETAANALENIGDTSRRVQGAIGENLLPAVKEAAAAIEGLLFSVEGNQGLKTATADTLAFATAMGGVTAGILGVAAVIPLLAGLAGPIGLAALAAGALAGAFVAAEVQAARFREEVSRTQSALQGALQIGQGEDSTAIQGQIERLEARRTALQTQIRAAEEAAQATEDSQPRLRRGEANPYKRTAEQILEASSAYETYQNQLFQTNKAIEILTRRTNKLGEAQEVVATTVEDKLSRSFQSLTDAASGTDTAIAEALQQFENANVGTDDQATDLARDIGNQLVSIAEATTAAQVRQAHARVEAYARDNSLIVAEDERLKALLLATEEAFQSRLNTFIASEQQQQFATDRFQAVEDANQGLRGIFESLQSGDLGADGVTRLNTEFDNLLATFDRLGVVVPNVQQLISRFDLGAALIEGQVGGDPDTRGERFSAIGRNISLGEQLLRKATQIEKDLAKERADAEESASEAAIAARKKQADASIAAAERVADRTQAVREKEQAAQEKQANDAARAVEQAQRGVGRLQERTLDAESSRGLQVVQREVQQAIDRYTQSGDAYAGVVRELTGLHQELGGAIEEAFRADRIERFREGVEGVVQDLASVTLDHVFDFFIDDTDRASEAVRTLSDGVQLLESDFLRLSRSDEDADTRRQRLEEDRDRRLNQLRRQQRTLAAGAPVGDQRALEQNIQRQQDISFRIAETREDFGVRLGRLGEDTDTGRSRFLEDAARRLSEVESRQSGEGLGSELADVLENAVKRALAAELSGYLTGKVFDTGVSLITAGLGALGIKEAISGLLGRLGIGGGGDGDGTGTPTLTTPDAGAGTGGTTSTPALTAPETSLAVLTQSTPALTAPTEAIAVLTQSVPTLTAPETSLLVPTHSTPALMAPLTSLEVLTHSTPTIIAPTTPISIPAQSISPDIDAVSPITIPANAISPTVNPVTDAIRIPAQAIIPTVHTPAAIDIPSNTINPVINAVNPITIPANAIDPVINAVSPITIPVNPITVQIDSPETIDLSKASVILPALLSQLLKDGGDDGAGPGESASADAEERTRTRESERLQQIIDRAPGKGVGDVPAGGEGNSGGLINALNSLKDSIDSSLESGLSALPDVVEGVVRSILGTGIGVGGDGVSFGAAGGGLTDAQVDALAASLGEDLDSSFRSDFIPTLLGNQPGTVQPGDPEPDDDIAQAPAAPRFTQAAAAGVSAVADVLSLEALSNVAQETTLSRIATATERIADAPLVQQLVDAGVAFPNDPTDPVNAAFTESPIHDFLGRGGLDLFSDFSNLQRQFDEGSIMRQDVDMSLVPGGTADNPAFVSLVNLQETQKVEVVGGSLDVTGKVDANVTNEVAVKQVGPFAVTQSGEFVVRLDSGQVLPVVVQGGRMVVDVSNLGDLAGALDIENVFRDFFGERVT